jgi:hypothetical protein
MSLTINVREATNATILQLAGRLTLGASGPSLRDTVRGLLDSLRKNIVLDLSGVNVLRQLWSWPADCEQHRSHVSGRCDQVIELEQENTGSDVAHETLHCVCDLYG